MTSQWYLSASSAAELTQGELIFDCPTVQSKSITSIDEVDEIPRFKIESIMYQADLIVMSQACDLAQRSVANVILCPFETLTEHRERWEEVMKAKDQTITAKAWKNYTDDLKHGFLFDLAILDNSPGMHVPEHLVVDFAELYSVPRDFLDSLISQRNRRRTCLSAPYREHLSQSFARFFMRVGLPTGLSTIPSFTLAPAKK
jgi:hypothetical protein